MNLYSYDGPVKEFNTCVSENWKATTYAISEKKARSNLAYRFKKEHGLIARSRVSLPGKIVMVERKDEYHG